ncbi:MAG TPA: cupin-like domain-containing protein [Acidimicrobiia bacterium]|nr:cupin-like domain-containing protein [Acidimicrobiia bacterium]
MTSIDVTTANVVEYPLGDEPLVTLDALGNAADRLPGQVEHHLGDLPVILPGGESIALDQTPGDAVRNAATNGCWVMIRSLGALPEYEALLRRLAARFELALRARGEQPVEHDLIAFIGAPGATVPVHFDRNHHVLIQVRGTKTVGTGTFTDPRVLQRQIERGMQPYRFNADVMPDVSAEHVLHEGEALVIPAFTFHWVQGHDDVSVAMTCVVGTVTTARMAAVHEFNLRARKVGLRPSLPGTDVRIDRAKQQTYRVGKRVTKSLTSIKDKVRERT